MNLELDRLHEEAMDLAEDALREKRRGGVERAKELFALALEKEQKVLKLLENEPYQEPMYSVLYRSAATLALDCGEFRLAEKLASIALSKEPLDYVANELRDVVEQATAARHLNIDSLDENEIEMSLSGNGVGHGLILSSEIENRREIVRKQIKRVGDDLYANVFRAKGRIKELFRIFESVPKAASFAVKFRIEPINPVKVLDIPQRPPSPSDVIAKFMSLISIVNSGEISRINSEIPDVGYRKNFINDIKKLAPDGDNVSQVGFSAVNVASKAPTSVAFRVTKKAIQSYIEAEEDLCPTDEHETVEGRLLSADATGKGENKTIKLVLDDGTQRIIEVSESEIDDIVRPYWNTDVKVVISRRNASSNNYRLVEIDPQIDGE